MSTQGQDYNECGFDLMQAHLAPLIIESGSGRVESSGTTLRFTVGATDGRHYSNAQADDYHDAGGGQFRWRPPLRLRVRACFSHDKDGLVGTAGFGFWNDPFGMTGSARWRLPRALWFFFGGAATDLPLAQGVPGHGWKAAMLDALRWEAMAVLPAAPLLSAVFQVPAIKARLWPRVQRRLRIQEALVPANMRDWHDYEIDWGKDRCQFRMDGLPILDALYSPKGPLGLVVWIDNQFMVATPQGRFRHGIVAAAAQWMEIESLVIQEQAVRKTKR